MITYSYHTHEGSPISHPSTRTHHHPSLSLSDTNIKHCALYFLQIHYVQHTMIILVKTSLHFPPPMQLKLFACHYYRRTPSDISIYTTYHTLHRSTTERIMIPWKWIESSELMPPHTKLLVSVSLETADVRTDQGNTKHVKV